MVQTRLRGRELGRVGTAQPRAETSAHTSASLAQTRGCARPPCCCPQAWRGRHCLQAAVGVEGVSPAAPGRGADVAEGTGAGRWRRAPSDGALGSPSLSRRACGRRRSRTTGKAALGVRKRPRKGLAVVPRESFPGAAVGSQRAAPAHPEPARWSRGTARLTGTAEKPVWGQLNDISRLCSWSGKCQLCCAGEGDPGAGSEMRGWKKSCPPHRPLPLSAPAEGTPDRATTRADR